MQQMRRLSKRPTDLAREKRKHPTPAEALLWQTLRNRQLESQKFRRQHVFIYGTARNRSQFLIVDFYCAARKLVIEIEVDGGYHDGQEELDKQRDLLLEDLFGIRVMRFRNEEVLGNLRGVLAEILQG